MSSQIFSLPRLSRFINSKWWFNLFPFGCLGRNPASFSISFDPMLAKLISWGENRSAAASKLVLALSEVVFLGDGLKTNRNYLQRILSSKPFLDGSTYTHFVKTYEEELKPKATTSDERALAIAAMLFDSQTYAEATGVISESGGVWKDLVGIRSV